MAERGRRRSDGERAYRETGCVVTGPAMLGLALALAFLAGCRVRLRADLRAASPGPAGRRIVVGIAVLAAGWTLGAPLPALALVAGCIAAATGVLLRWPGGWSGLSDGRLEPIRDAFLLAYVAAASAAVVEAGGPAGVAAAGALAGLAALGALALAWPLVCDAQNAPRPGMALDSFLRSCGYGALALAAMAEGLAWPFLLYPAVAQLAAIAAGLAALDADDSRRDAEPCADHGGAGARLPESA